MNNIKSYKNIRLNRVTYKFNQRVFDVAQYLKRNYIHNVVVGFSGGVDSTFVLFLLQEVKRKFINHLNIFAHTIEYRGEYDMFNYDDVQFVIDSGKFSDVNFSNAILSEETVIDHLESLTFDGQDSEVIHNYLYAHRYTQLFLLAQSKKAITVGTTNLDEIAYVGWFGKNSDMMVDLQFIADFHKFEIKEILTLNDIQILSEPKGDILCGRTDEEVFGVTYDELAFYSYKKCHLNNQKEIIPIESLDKLHKQNKHKYYGQTFNPLFIVDKNDYFIYEYPYEFTGNVSSFIYDEIFFNHGYKFLEECGYFRTEFPIPLDKNSHAVFSFFEEEKKITENTQVFYYSGAFTYFHEGHISVIKKALEVAKDDFVIVISPANSDYIYKKYNYHHNVGNKARYDRIKNLLKQSFTIEELQNIVIDLNPMLNFDRDFNFTDLMKYFIEKYIPFEKLKHKPVICCGKDRDFRKLAEYSNKVDVLYVGEEDGSFIDYHSKEFLELSTKLIKKICYFRCNNEKEYNAFKHYFGKYYYEIEPLYLEMELNEIRRMIYENEQSNSPKRIATICKEYADLLPYIPFSRQFENPLENSTFVDNPLFDEYDVIVDSDSFSGKTKEFITENHDVQFIALYDIQSYGFDLNKIDIVDVSDIVRDDFRYPYVDVMERMGLRSFTERTHDLLDKTRWKLKQVQENSSK